MTTNNDNQPKTNTPTFEKEQEVWVKARIKTGIILSDKDIAVNIRSANHDRFLFCLSTEIRTTEQILMEEAIKNDLKSDKFRVYIDDVRQSLNYYYLYAPDGTEHVYPKECFSPSEVIDICDEENAKIATQNAKQNAELPEHNAELPEHNANLTEPDRNRRFKKGDKVRIVERWGRTPWLNCSNLELGKTYTVYADEEVEDEEIYLEAYDNSEGISPFFLDLVKPATEPRFLCQNKVNGYYLINFKRSDGRLIVAKTLNAKLFTFEEAQEECEKMNQKYQDNE